ncbi:MFS transporter [Gammaproteobacteria bacterium]|nr:MFS transporter [Gammaproteobacteria bacterium]
MKIPIRFRLVFMSFLAVFICYIDRINISIAIIPMQEQFGWSEAQIGIIFSVFYAGYFISMALGGFLADKYGGKVVLGLGVLLWSLFTILTPVFSYNGFFALLFIRVLIGMGEGITFPSWHSLYAHWIPFKERTRVIAITNSGIPIGTIFAYIVSALIIASYSWEWVFYSFGALGLIWFFFWQRYIYAYPHQDKKITNKELTLIKNEAPADSTALTIPLSSLLRNLPFMSISVATFCNNWALFTFLSYLPKFVNSLGVSLDSSAFLLMILIPSIVSVAALISGGYLADYLIKNGYKVIKVRKTVNTIGFFGAAFCLFMVPLQESLISIIILLCITNLCTGIGAGGFGVNHADLGPNYTGTLFGIAGSIGMIAAIISPLVAGFILELTGSWSLIFHICSAVLIFGGAFYLIFASATKQFK